MIRAGFNAGASKRPTRGAGPRPPRGEIQASAKAPYVQGGWRVVVVVVVVVDLVVGRARRARAAAAATAAALKSRERVHETEARRVEDAVLGRRVALHLGVARAPRLAQIDLRALRAGGLPVERRLVLVVEALFHRPPVAPVLSRRRAIIKRIPYRDADRVDRARVERIFYLELGREACRRSERVARGTRVVGAAIVDIRSALVVTKTGKLTIKAGYLALRANARVLAVLVRRAREAVYI